MIPSMKTIMDVQPHALITLFSNFKPNKVPKTHHKDSQTEYPNQIWPEILYWTTLAKLDHMTMNNEVDDVTNGWTLYESINGM